MTDQERARERAKELVLSWTEDFDISNAETKYAALEIRIATALLEARREALEDAAMRAYDELSGLPDCQRRIARAIQELKGKL